jgi:hypothetical protein
MTGPRDPAAVGDRLRVGHADRERVVEVLKDAFVQGRLTKDELGARAGQALTARTGADLAALTADIPAPARTSPARPVAAGPARPSAPARRWPLAKAVAGSGGCLVIAAAALRVAGWADPGATPGTIPKFLALPSMLVALFAALAALAILAYGVGASIEHRRARKRAPGARPHPPGTRHPRA